ncbi:MAG: hypothetical protein JXN59_12025 [Anaerolineae bacterium]|nr:hypothetical protein [Anaerolineae bacterium]
MLSTLTASINRLRLLAARLPRLKPGRLLRLGLLCLFIIVFFRGSVPPPGDLYTVAASHARDNLFDYVGWEVEALGGKLLQSAFGPASYLDENTRADIVRAYMRDLDAVLQLEAQIAAIYSDPTLPNPDSASAELRAERDRQRASLEERQGLAEHILESQIAAVLAEAGLAVLGQVLPPVAIHMTPLPDVLIISPRDEIRVAASLSLDDVPADRRSALEDTIDADLEMRSLVVDIGGMALYPSMVMESGALAWVLETTAHEWVHHYLYFFPLGLNYFDNGNPDTRIINETTAELLGKEIGLLALRHYYPELAPPEAPAVAAPPSPAPPDPAAFDISAAMHDTRVTVDALLAAGEVDEAEAYMAERQLLFAENGYPIRRLNQAYFAFYGGYQGEDNAGTAGEDPIGPAVAALREQSGSLAAFLQAVRGITTREQLLSVVAPATPLP